MSTSDVTPKPFRGTDKGLTVVPIGAERSKQGSRDCPGHLRYGR
jgi:hypothetical protein